MAKVINGRLYFSWHEIQAWVAKQRGAARTSHSKVPIEAQINLLTKSQQ